MGQSDVSDNLRSVRSGSYFVGTVGLFVKSGANDFSVV